MKETARHREAFEWYYGLGEKRNIVVVAGKYGVSEMTLARWSKEFEWQKRILDRDKKIADAIEKKADTKEINRKLRMLRFIDDIYEGNESKIKGMDVEGVSDLIALSKHEQLLSGEATERSDDKIRVILPEGMDGSKL